MSRFLRIGLCFALTLATFSLIAAPQAAHAAVGDVDTSVTLNGSTQYAWVADDNSLDVANALTVEAWVKPTSISTCGSSDTCIILNKESSYELAIYNGTYQHAILGTSTGTWAFQDTGVKAIINEWHHVAITRALNTYTTKFYLDGVLAATDSSGDGAGTSTISNSIYPFTIGARSSNGVTFTSKFTGQIDEVKVWGVERSATNVVSDMSNWGPTNTSGLQLYYDFNDISGSPGTVVNRVSGATSASTLSLGNSPTVSDVKTTDTTTAPGYTILKFPRSYITANGGWKVPTNTSSLKIGVIGGGGGGSGGGWNSGVCDVGGGGGGGGGDVQESTVNVNPNNSYPIQVGQGGNGGTTPVSSGKGTAGINGGNSSAFSISANGGYGAAQASTACGSAPGGTAGNGNVGGTEWTATTSQSSRFEGTGGGGGGVGSAGGNSGGSNTSTPASNYAGNGGTGASLTFLSGSYFGAGGGGGASLWHGGGMQGSGGSSIGGNGSSTGVLAGAAVVNTGSGGGGGASGGGGAGAGGGSGSAGMVIIKYKNYFGSSISISVNPKKTTKSSAATPITATTTSTGTVTFYANGRVINGCLNVAVSGTTATCNWRPITQGQVTLSATYTSNDPLYSGTAAATSFVTSVGKRTSAR